MFLHKLVGSTVGMGRYEERQWHFFSRIWDTPEQMWMTWISFGVYLCVFHSDLNVLLVSGWRARGRPSWSGGHNEPPVDLSGSPGVRLDGPRCARYTPSAPSRDTQHRYRWKQPQCHQQQVDKLLNVECMKLYLYHGEKHMHFEKESDSAHVRFCTHTYTLLLQGTAASGLEPLEHEEWGATCGSGGRAGNRKVACSNPGSP